MKRFDKYSKIFIYGAGLVVSAVILATSLTDGNYPVAGASFVGILLFGRGVRNNWGE